MFDLVLLVLVLVFCFVYARLERCVAMQTEVGNNLPLYVLWHRRVGHILEDKIKRHDRWLFTLPDIV